MPSPIGSFWIGGVGDVLGPLDGYGYNNFTLDANNDKMTWLFHAPEAATITQLYCRPSTVAATSPTFQISLQGGGNKVADGTIKGATLNAKKTFQPSALGWTAGVGQWLTLDESYTCSRGEYLAIVLEYSSGTPSTDAFTYALSSAGLTHMMPGFVDTNNGADTQRSVVPIFGYASNTRSYMQPISEPKYNIVDSGTNPDEIGIRFSISSTALSTFKVGGAAFRTRWESTGGTINFTLYDNSNNLIQQHSITSNYHQMGTNNGWCLLIFDEVNLTTLNADTIYRWVITPTSIVTDFRAYEVGFVRSQDADIYRIGSLGTWEWTQRFDGGSWTQNSTKLPCLQLLISDYTLPAGGGTFMPRPIQIGM